MILLLGHAGFDLNLLINADLTSTFPFSLLKNSLKY